MLIVVRPVKGGIGKACVGTGVREKLQQHGQQKNSRKSGSCERKEQSPPQAASKVFFPVFMLHGTKTKDKVYHSQYGQHVKEVEIAQGSESCHGNEQIPFFFVKYALYADKKQGEIDHGIDKIWMDGGKGNPVAAEGINEAPGKGSHAFTLHPETIAGKCSPGKIQAQKNQEGV